MSTVDSGNLIASFWTLEQGIEEILSSPLISDNFLDGLKDTFENGIHEIPNSHSLQKLKEIKTILNDCPFNVFNASTTINSLLAAVREFNVEILNDHISEKYWFEKLEKQLVDFQEEHNRYFSWLDKLQMAPLKILNKLNDQSPHWKDILSKQHLSITSLSSGQFIEELKECFPSIWELKPGEEALFETFKESLKEALMSAEFNAKEKETEAHEIIQSLHALSEAMNMEFLYDKERKLFSIGYHVDNLKLDSSYYDLLASEARIASLVAIGKGDVPLDHWWALGRVYGKVGKNPILMSWGGTMFEYLMPLIFTHNYPNTLLGDATLGCVLTQIQYAKKLGIPWGISESAFSEIDIQKTYQYRSFGVPGLGLKRGLEEDLVVSPYSTLLALIIQPTKAIENLKKLSSLYHLYNSYGFYESIDFSRQHGPHGKRGVIVYAFMVHHQGMSLLTITNLLLNRLMQNRFTSDPRIKGIDPLLMGKSTLFPCLC